MTKFFIFAAPFIVLFLSIGAAFWAAARENPYYDE